MVTLVTRDPCWCGYLREGLLFPTVRINKRSMRSHGVNLGVYPGRCEECGRDTSCDPTRLVWRLDPDSAAKVRAYRLRRWPELAGEDTHG
jgi:hypothetical protein